jgi:hypothetical protein
MIQQTTQFTNKQMEKIGKRYMVNGFTKLHQKTINEDLRALGVGRYDFWLPETHTLPYIIHPDEHIKGIVYGHYKHSASEPASGRGALVATDSRILLIDKKPLFLRCDELTYHVVSGVTYTKVGMAGTVTLHTRAGDIQMRTLNSRCANTFVAAIETLCIEWGTKI